MSRIKRDVVLGAIDAFVDERGPLTRADANELADDIMSLIDAADEPCPCPSESWIGRVEAGVPPGAHGPYASTRTCLAHLNRALGWAAHQTGHGAVFIHDIAKEQ